MADLQIFRVGKHTSTDGRELDFTEADLRKMALVYDPGKHEAPLVVGHPKTDDPAYGWVRSLHFAEPVLVAEPAQVDLQFQEMVNAGRFNKVSASFYLPDSPQNPVQGAYYLRHVGFLGATAPAVKGLRSASFSAGDEGLVSVEFAAPAPAPAPAPGAAAGADLAAREAALAAREAELARKEQAAELAARMADRCAFAEKLEREGRLLPRDRAGLVAFLAGLEGTLEFADAEGKPAKQDTLAWAKDFFARLPVQVSFGEHCSPEEPPLPVDFSAPAGATVDPAGLALHRRALAYQAQNKCDYMAAVRAVGGKR
jgi:hypothetical protein